MNGNVILHTLAELKEPSTIREIVAYIADTAGVHPKEIKAPIVELLDKGVQFGFIKCRRRRYFVEKFGKEAATALHRSMSKRSILYNNRRSSVSLVSQINSPLRSRRSGVPRG